MFDLKKFNKKDTKINLVSLTFSIETYKKIKGKDQDKLTSTAKDFLHILSEFDKLKKQEDEMKIIMLDEQIQELPTDTCRIFQLYFYQNLFDPDSESKIINDEFLTKKTVTKLKNEIFSTNKEINENKKRSNLLKICY